MAYYPQNATGLNYISYPVGPTATGIVATASATPNTKGAYTEIASSSGFQSNAATINLLALPHGGTVPYTVLVDLATGAAGVETVVVPNVPFDFNNATASTTSLMAKGLLAVPLKIAMSTRIAARCQSNVASIQAEFSLSLVAAGGVDGVTPFTNYGSDTSSSGAVSIDPGGTANTKGSYSQISASLSAVVQWLALMMIHGSSTISSCFWLVDIATGAAASEVVLIPDIGASAATSVAVFGPQSIGFLTYIAASTRVAIRASCSINTATARLLQAALLSTVAPTEPSGGGGGAWAFA